MKDLAAEFRRAARHFVGRPAYAVVSISTLALGIGANTLAFSLLYGTTFRGLPFPESAELYLLRVVRTNRDGSTERYPWSWEQYSWFRGQSAGRIEVAAYNRNGVTLSGDADATRALVEVVTPEYFSVLRVAPALGRTFGEDEHVSAGTHPVVVLGDAIWRSRFGAAADVLGKTIRANGVALEVIGVMPRGFAGVSGSAELWIPEMMAPAVTNAEQLTTTESFHYVIARSGPDGVNALSTAVTALAESLHAAVPRAESADGAASLGVEPVRLSEAGADPMRRRSAALLFGAVWFVLAVACVNLGILQLGRASERSREMAILTALGCSRRRLVEQRLTEGGVLAVLGCIGGLAIAFGSLPLLRSVSPMTLPSASNLYATVAEFANLRLDGTVLVFALFISMATVVIGSIVPTLRATRADMNPLLRSGIRETGSGLTLRRAGPLVWLTILEIACALVLAVGAALLVRSFARTRAVEHGFDAQNLITFRIHPIDPTFSVALAPGRITPVLERVRGIPGIESATVSMCTPFMATCGRRWLSVAGRPTAGEPPVTGVHYVSPDHFRTLRIPLIRGRSFTSADVAGAPRVAVINQTAALTLWPDVDPIGHRIALGDTALLAWPDSLHEIVGIVGDVTYWPADQQARLDVYTPYTQFTYATTYVIARTAGQPAAMLPLIRSALRELDATLGIDDVKTMEARANLAASGRRFIAGVQSGFAFLGLVLAVLGVYGVASISMSKRRREMGVRIAIGATPWRIFRRVMAEGSAVTVAGLAVGTLLSLALTRTIESLLFEVSPSDFLTFTSMAAVVAGVALLAFALPAWRVTRVEPTEVIRAE